VARTWLDVPPPAITAKVIPHMFRIMVRPMPGTEWAPAQEMRFQGVRLPVTVCP
jgi:hypothetical protein